MHNHDSNSNSSTNSTFTDGPNNHGNIDYTKAFKADQGLFYHDQGDKNIDFDDNRSQQSFYENENINEIQHNNQHEFKKCISKVYENYLDFQRQNTKKQQSFSIEIQSDADSDCYESTNQVDDMKNNENEEGEVSPRDSSKHHDSNFSLDSN